MSVVGIRVLLSFHASDGLGFKTQLVAAAEGELTHRALTYAHTMACAQWTGRERGGGGGGVKEKKKKRLRGNVARRICCSLRTANLSKNSPGLRATYTNII